VSIAVGAVACALRDCRCNGNNKFSCTTGWEFPVNLNFWQRFMFTENSFLLPLLIDQLTTQVRDIVCYALLASAIACFFFHATKATLYQEWED
jgi:hypothetical protein